MEHKPQIWSGSEVRTSFELNTVYSKNASYDETYALNASHMQCIIRLGETRSWNSYKSISTALPLSRKPSIVQFLTWKRFSSSKQMIGVFLPSKMDMVIFRMKDPKLGFNPYGFPCNSSITVIWNPSVFMKSRNRERVCEVISSHRWQALIMTGLKNTHRSKHTTYCLQEEEEEEERDRVWRCSEVEEGCWGRRYCSGSSPPPPPAAFPSPSTSPSPCPHSSSYRNFLLKNYFPLHTMCMLCW